MLIDAHIHFWQLGLHDYAWMPADETHVLRRDFLPSKIDAERQAVGVRQVVAVQAANTIDETAWLLALADEYQFIAGVVGWVDLTSEDCLHQLDKFQRAARFVGVRHLTEAEADDKWLLQKTVIRNLREFARRDVPFDLLVRPRHLKRLAELFAACPETKFVINHLAKPNIAAREFDAWAREIQSLAVNQNLYCKLSGWHTEAHHQTWTHADFNFYFAHALECFSAARLMFGSDYPVCTQAATYRQTVETINALTNDLPLDDKQKIYSTTAARFYRLNQRIAKI